MRIELQTEWGYVIVHTQDHLLPLHKLLRSLDHVIKGMGYTPRGTLDYTLPLCEADYEVSSE